MRADEVGLGTGLSPLGNWTVSAFGETPNNGCARMCDANATGSAGVCAQICWST